jgi:tetratricopeptide (TPR) repeat protein
MQKHDEAIKDMDVAIKLDPKNHLFYNGKGVSLLSIKKYQEAVDNFSSSIQLNPDFGQAYFNRGYAKQFVNDMDGACKDWTTAAAKGYKSANSYLKQFCGK